MFSKSRPTHQFLDDSNSSYDGRTEGSKMEKTVTSTYDGPRFPNLHMMFKHKEAPTEDEERFTVKTSQAVAYEKEDVDMETDDYIKRKHRSLELQKLMSMKGQNQHL